MSVAVEPAEPSPERDALEDIGSDGNSDDDESTQSSPRQDSEAEQSPAVVFDEDCVRREKDAIDERMDLANQRVKDQLKIMERINQTLAEDDDYEPPDDVKGGGGFYSSPDALGTFVNKGPAVTMPSGGFFTGSSPGVTSKGTFHKVTGHMLDKVFHRQYRNANFQYRRQQVLEEQEGYQRHITSHLADEEKRVAECLKDKMDESRRRAHAQNQRRAEKQKYCQMMALEKDRAYESYYGPNGEPKADMSKSNSRFPDKSTPADQSILRSTMQSRDMYSSRIDDWKNFVSENEQRTHAYWKKKLGNNYQAYVDQLRGTQSPKGKAEVSKVVKAKGKWVSRSPGGRSDDESTEKSGFEIESRSTSTRQSPTRGIREETMNPFDVGSPGGSMSPTHGPAVWKMRHDQAKDYLLNDALRREEDWSKTSQGLNDARKRKEAKDNGIMRAAKQRGAEFNAKMKEVNRRRGNADLANDVNLTRKHQEAGARRAEEFGRQNDERIARAAQKNAAIAEGQAVCREKLEQKWENGQEEIDRKDKQTVEHYDTLHTSWDDRAANSKDPQQLLMERLDRKKVIEEEYRDKARGEINMKRIRSTSVLSKTQQSSFDKSRALRRGKSAVALRELRGGAGTLPALLETTDEEKFVKKIEEKGSKWLQEMELILTKVSDDKPVKQLDGEDGEEKFVKKLEGRSSKWLQDMRKKIADDGPRSIR